MRRGQEILALVEELQFLAESRALIISLIAPSALSVPLLPNTL
jgi:hypothetical protein